ncbi:unnamed protein product [Auanema sp. JU1783]|nr:unnamed protein product [Auanema sp. JU1783]
MNDEQQRMFEVAIVYSDHGLSYIPLNFMLGFFVTAVLGRWLTLYKTIGFIDNLSIKIAMYVRGSTPDAVLYRRTVLRYCSLGQILVFRDISMKTRRRFPTLDSVVAAGYMHAHEKEVFDSLKSNFGKHWMIFQWSLARLYEARKKGFIESDYYLVQIEEAILTYRAGLSWLIAYDWCPIPLVYPQLVCLAVHTFFLISLIARQYIISPHATHDTQVDIYFPVMGSLQFMFYMGWMKIAEVMLNPFGEDDDDFESNRIIDRNFELGMEVVDQGYNNPPALLMDRFRHANVTTQKHPLYSEEASRMPNYHLRESVSHLELPESTKVVMVPHADDYVEKEPLFGNIRDRLSSISVASIFSRNRQMEVRRLHEQVGRTSKRNSLPCPSIPTQISSRNVFENSAFDEDEELNHHDTIPRPSSNLRELRDILKEKGYCETEDRSSISPSSTVIKMDDDDENYSSRQKTM